MTLDLNGDILKDAKPSLMIFPMGRLDSFISERVTLDRETSSRPVPLAGSARAAEFDPLIATAS